MRRISLSLALACAVAACSPGAKAPGTTGAAKGVLGQYFYVQLAVPVGGALASGDGAIACQPSGTGCGDATFHQTRFDWNTPVVLTATALAGHTFQGWAGDCFGDRVSGNVCTLSGTDTDYIAGAVFSDDNAPKPPPDTPPQPKATGHYEGRTYVPD